ncbi:MAG: hypothetical protein H0Z33_10815 [Bacillaceae bacterium]|nr:hypothetical protein [Bacillaceae bacterium]
MENEKQTQNQPGFNPEPATSPRFMNKSDSGDPNRPQTSRYVGPDVSNQTTAVPNLEETRIDRPKVIGPPVDPGTGRYDGRLEEKQVQTEKTQRD